MNEMTQEPKIVEGTNGGAHVVDGPLTTTAARAASPGLLMSEIDKRVVKVRPMATPIDQISRMVGAAMPNQWWWSITLLTQKECRHAPKA